MNSSMAFLLLYNARVALAHGVQHGGVLVRDGRISQVFPREQTPAGFSREESLDLEDAYLAPGLIDIHIHGSAGVDVQATDEDGLVRLSKFLLSEGVASYFATLVPADERSYEEALASIRLYVADQDAQNNNQPLARIIGIHFEGPFVSGQRCGALNARHFRTYDGDPRSVSFLTGGAPDEKPNLARLVTLAPEIERGLDLTRDLTRSGVRVFIGHSQADPDTLDRAAEAGACHITHFPNALDPLHHRRPGAIAWGLLRKDVTLDCIADLHHVHPMMLRLMHHAKGADRMALISDAIMPAGLGDGEFSVWGERITVQDGRTALTRRPDEDTIAGSVITMRQALKNIVELGVPIHEAIRMATLVPARVAGVESECGSIEQGKRADLIALDDNFAVRLAMVSGRLLTQGR